MGTFSLSINIIVPLCLFCCIGYFTRQRHLISEEGYSQLNKLVFRILLPSGLLYSTFHSNFRQGFPIKYGLFGALGVLAVFLITFIVIACTHYPNEKKGVIIQGISRSNFVLLGFPIIQSVYGPHIGATAILISFVVPLFNLLSVIALEFYSGEKVDYLHMIWNICRNPLILGSLAGMVLNLVNFPMPYIFDKTLSLLNDATTPLALIALGGTFQFKAVKTNLMTLISVNFCRLVLIPFVFVGLAIIMGFRYIELMSLFIAFGSPTAVSSDSMAQEMNGDVELAGQIVFSTTFLSVFSLFIWISLMKTYHLI